MAASAEERGGACTSTGRGMWWCPDGSPGAPPDTRALPAALAGEYRADGAYHPRGGAAPAAAAAGGGACAMFADGAVACGRAPAAAAARAPQTCLYDAYGERTCKARA